MKRILSFKQSVWLKADIDYNIMFRNAAKSKLQNNFYKLMNNAIYGKTKENVNKRVDVKLLTTWKNVKRRCGAHTYCNAHIYMYIGFAVLDILPS